MSKGWACVTRLGGIGDNLIAASTLRPLKRLGYQVEVITSELAHVVYLNSPFVDKLSVKAEKDIPGGDKWHEWFVQRSHEYDLFAHLSHTGEVRHALFSNSTAFWWRQDYRRKICAGSYLETAHDIVGVPHEFGPVFFPTEDEKIRAKWSRDNTTKGPYIVWVVAGSRLDKIYSAASMIIPRLIKELGMPVFMIGAGALQFKMAEEIERAVRLTNSSLEGLHLALSPDGSDPGGAFNWPIRRSLTLALNADLVITPDTGIAWAVAMEPIPKIMLLSHASEENITKHWVNTTTLHADPNRVPCWPCHRLHNDISTCVGSPDNPNAAACINDVSVETLLQTARSCLRVPA